jgi:hypothetical protein
MLIVAAPADAAVVQQACINAGEEAFLVGDIVEWSGAPAVIFA